jgi:hypothetical protein
VLRSRFLLSLVIALFLSTLASADSVGVTQNSATLALDSEALLLARHAPASEFKGLVLYTPVGRQPGARAAGIYRLPLHRNGDAGTGQSDVASDRTDGNRRNSPTQVSRLIRF